MRYLFQTLSTIGVLSCTSLVAEATKPQQKPTSTYVAIDEINQPSWYVGGAYEVNDFFALSSSNTFRPNHATGSKDTETLKLNNPGMGFQAFFGYNCNRYFAVEMKYDQLLSKHKVTKTLTLNPDTNDFNGTEVIQKQQIIFGPYFLFNIPISQYFTPYFKGGMSTIYRKETGTYTYASGATGATGSETGWDERFGYGVGIKSQFVKHFGMRVEYENYLNFASLYHIMGNVSLAGFVSF